MTQRIIFFVIGAVLIIFCAAGSLNTICLQLWGIRTEAKVLEINSGRRSNHNNFNSANYGRFRGNRFITTSYMVNVEYQDKVGTLKTQWTQVGPETKRFFNVTTDATVPFIYVPNTNRSMVGDNPPEWQSIIWLLIYLPLGIMMILLGILRRKFD